MKGEGGERGTKGSEERGEGGRREVKGREVKGEGGDGEGRRRERQEEPKMTMERENDEFTRKDDLV